MSKNEYDIKYVFTSKAPAEKLAKKLGCSGVQEFFNKDKKQSGLEEKTYYLPCSNRKTMHNKLAKFKKKQVSNFHLATNKLGDFMPQK